MLKTCSPRLDEYRSCASARSRICLHLRAFERVQCPISWTRSRTHPPAADVRAHLTNGTGRARVAMDAELHETRGSMWQRPLRHTPTGVLRRVKPSRLSTHDRSGFHHGAGAPRVCDPPPIAVVRVGRARRADPDARRGSERPRGLPHADPRHAHGSAFERAHSRVRASVGAARFGSSLRPSFGSSLRPSLRPSIGSSLEEPLIQRARAVPPPLLFGKGCSRSSLPARNIR